MVESSLGALRLVPVLLCSSRNSLVRWAALTQDPARGGESLPTCPYKLLRANIVVPQACTPYPLYLYMCSPPPQCCSHIPCGDLLVATQALYESRYPTSV